LLFHVAPETVDLVLDQARDHLREGRLPNPAIALTAHLTQAVGNQRVEQDAVRPVAADDDPGTTLPYHQFAAQLVAAAVVRLPGDIRRHLYVREPRFPNRQSAVPRGAAGGLELVREPDARIERGFDHVAQLRDRQQMDAIAHGGLRRGYRKHSGPDVTLAKFTAVEPPGSASTRNRRHGAFRRLPLASGAPDDQRPDQFGQNNLESLIGQLVGALNAHGID